MVTISADKDINTEILKNNIIKALETISENEIEKEKESILKLDKNEFVSLPLEKNGIFNETIHKDLKEYFFSEDNNVVRKVRSIYLRQLALYQLFLAGYVMPVNSKEFLEPEKLQYTIYQMCGGSIKLNFIFNFISNCFVKFVVVKKESKLN